MTNPDRFKLIIVLGNDAMQTGHDVAKALRNAAYHLDDATTLCSGRYGKVHDDNGNTVGQFEVE